MHRVSGFPHRRAQFVWLLPGETESARSGRLHSVVAFLLFTAACIAMVTLPYDIIAEDNGTVAADEDRLSVIDVTHPIDSEWPQWGGNAHRNHVSPDISLPTHFSVKDKVNVAWTAKLGRSVNNTPVVANGRVFIGTSNAGYSQTYPASIDLGTLVCVDLESGKLNWQYSVPKLPAEPGIMPYPDWPEQGICSAPCVDGDRLWLVNNRCELVCLDVDGFHDGKNDGPVTDEPDTSDNAGDVIWRFDMIEQLGVTPSHVSCTSPTIVGDLLLLNTTHSAIIQKRNGVQGNALVADPDIPAFVAFHRDTGALVWQDKTASLNTLDVSWSSPAFGVIDGVAQAIFAGGDGWLYGFDADSLSAGQSKLLWKFDCNEKTSDFQPGGLGTRNVIVATPVIHNHKVFITTGRNPMDGDGPGMAWCIDARKRGDLSEHLVFSQNSPSEPIVHRRLQACDESLGDYTKPNANSGVVWKFAADDTDGDGRISDEESMHRSTSCVTVSRGFAFVADHAGYVHCLNAQTGKAWWHHDFLASTAGTPLVAGDRIFIGDDDGKLTIFDVGQTKTVVAELESDSSIHGSLVAVKSKTGPRLLVPAQRRLICVGQ